MNQILKTDLNNDLNNDLNQNIYNSNYKKNIKFLMKFQLHFSISLIIIICTIFINNTINLYKKEKYSSKVLDNYNITRLYSNNYQHTTNNLEENYIIGIINIPSLNVYYPIFSNFSEDLLKISPCRLYGPLPGMEGNLCIAGHNYDNDKFFSQIKNLNIRDEIIIYDNMNQKISYLVTQIYEVKFDDVSPIYDYNENLKQLTLITCNNLNNNRIIIRAILL